VLTWLDGDPVSRLPVPDRNALAEPLAGALARLHRPAPVDAPENPLRAVPLANRAADVEARWPAVRDHLGPDAAAVLRSAWESGLDAPGWDRAPVWVHGDPHPSNLVHRRGRDLGLVDFGDLTSGDPATDVATAWLTFDAAGRRRFLDVLLDQGSYDDALEARAAAWAALVAAAVSVADQSGADHHAMARHVVEQLGG
jgi:aminoglycoside phosphotransferase (APT) family kinase protein